MPDRSQVEVVVEKATLKKKLPGAGKIASAAVLILLGLSSATYAATINRADCDLILRTVYSPANHQHFEISKLHPIDHVAIHDSATDIESLNSADAISSDATTPFLYLTPRVASALREIFDLTENEASNSGEDSVLSSPIARIDDASETVELLEDSTITESINDEFDRYILQRQIFRTDI
jgi:hypothetical protein